MPRSPNKVTLLLFSSIAVLLMLNAVIVPASATTIIQLQPTTVSSGDRVLISANVAQNGSTATLSYYYDKNGNGLADDAGSSWIKIANVTDGGANDADNHTNGYILYSWMTPELSPGQYIIKAEDQSGARTTELTVVNAPLDIVPVIYGPQGLSSPGLIDPGNAFQVFATVTGNCRLCHTTDNPTAQNPGVNITSVESLFSANLSQLNPSETSVQPNIVNMSTGTEAYVAWTGIASKTLAANQTLSVTVTGTNPAGNLTTQATAYAGVGKAVNIAPTSTNQTPSGSAQATAQSSGSSGNPLPGFEIPIALAGLVFVAYLINRRR